MSICIGRGKHVFPFVWDHEHHGRTGRKTHINGRKIVVVEWMIVASIANGGNPVAVIASWLGCGAGNCHALVTILHLKLAEVELVRVFPSTNFGQNVLVVVVTQCSSKLLVCHVFTAIPLAPEMCHQVGLYDGKLAMFLFPRNDWTVPRLRQDVENELENLGWLWDFAAEQSCEG